MALFEREIEADQGRRLQMRDAHLRPLDPACPLHLRRICGTCAAFPELADMRAKAQPCARLKITVNGVRCAANCKFWTRKLARADRIGSKQEERNLG